MTEIGMTVNPDHPPAARTEWTCPMHPQIVRDAPGSCPICGMALEPRTVTVEEPPNPELADMSRRFWVALVLSLPVLVLAMADMIAAVVLMAAAIGTVVSVAMLVIAAIGRLLTRPTVPPRHR